jgi:hypothetical protein
VNIITAQDGPKTFATVAPHPGAPLAALGVTGQGVARCRPGDLQVQAHGELISIGRALQDLGQKVEAIGLDASICEADVMHVLDALSMLATESPAVLGAQRA